jgi:alkylation response protein AidB-like acyl-CoA dehydrogenase
VSGLLVQRHLPTPEAEALLALVREIARDELAPRAAAAEEAGRFPADMLALLGSSGLLGLAYPEEYGGGGQPYEVYLQVLEELASAWATVALSVSVHGLSCVPVAAFGTPQQREEWLPPLLAGEKLGAYALSEPHAGSDAAALTTRAEPDGEEYVLTGSKAWITHGGHADVYATMARTSPDGARGISCFLVPGDAAGLEAGRPERKMGFTGSPTSGLSFDGVRVPASHRVGAEGEGFGIAMAALDLGRLGIAAVAVGLAQAALDEAVTYAGQREAFGRPVIEFQGLAFELADMAAGIAAARALYLDAARRRDRGEAFGPYASMAKLVATDTAMAVTTAAVGVLGGYGYVRDYPVERYLREAKVLQIVEGTNQIQRMVVGRALQAAARRAGSG